MSASHSLPTTLESKTIHFGDRSMVFFYKKGSESFALKISPESAWRNEMNVYKTVQKQCMNGSKFIRIQKILASGEIIKEENMLCTDKKNKYYILTSYNNLRDVNAWLLRIPGITEAMRFKAARETLLALKELHQLGFVSRDVKMENFGVHITKDHRLKFCIYDFELSQMYKNIETQELTVRKPEKEVGTREYAPLVQMNESRPCYPVDDIEGWFYCLYFIFCNGLPWNRFTPDSDFPFNEKYDEQYSWIRSAKKNMHNTGEIYCAQKYDCMMSAIFKIILKWSKTPESAEMHFYDEICSILKQGSFTCGYDGSKGCNKIHCKKHKIERHDA